MFPGAAFSIEYRASRIKRRGVPRHSLWQGMLTRATRIVDLIVAAVGTAKPLPSAARRYGRKPALRAQQPIKEVAADVGGGKTTRVRQKNPPRHLGGYYLQAFLKGLPTLDLIASCSLRQFQEGDHSSFKFGSGQGQHLIKRQRVSHVEFARGDPAQRREVPAAPYFFA